MHRFHLPPEQVGAGDLVLREGEAHHAVRVLRLKPGEIVSVLDGAGGRCRCQVGEVSRHEVRLTLLRRQEVTSPTCRVVLLQALPKGRTMEIIIQKATELGAFEIIPLLSSRVEVHVKQENVAAKLNKWRQTAIESMKQCGSAWLPRIHAPIPLGDCLASRDQPELSLVGSLEDGALHPREVFDTFQNEHGRPPRSVAVWIGPEGDFTGEELASITSSGARPVSLGTLVLRSETAAIYALSIVNHELQARFEKGFRQQRD